MASPTQNPYLVFDQRFDLGPSEDHIRPILLFASIWRSGSTLLQRTLCTDSSLIMWGEPYAQLGLITSFAENAKCLYEMKWPQPKNWLFDMDDCYENLSAHFIANLYPKPRFLRESYRAQLDHLFVASAKARGFSRIGIKFVRCHITELHFLEWLYPNARFIVLVRNPWDAWKSYKGCNWIFKYPNLVVKKASQFAQIWKRNTETLLQSTKVLPIRYEDLIGEHRTELVEVLRSYCELDIDESAFEHRIKGVLDFNQPEVTDADLAVIQKVCGSVAAQMGYTGLGETASGNPFTARQAEFGAL